MKLIGRSAEHIDRECRVRIILADRKGSIRFQASRFQKGITRLMRIIENALEYIFGSFKFTGRRMRFPDFQQGSQTFALFTSRFKSLRGPGKIQDLVSGIA